MKNININFNTIYQKLQQNISIALWVFLAIIIALEGLVIKRSVDMVQTVRNQPEEFQTKVVRVDNKLYESLENEITSNITFEASPVTAPNPFGSSPQIQ